MQIEPVYMQHMGDFAGHDDRDVREWSTVYTPMSKYLFSSFRHLLQEKMKLLSCEAATAINSVSLPVQSDRSKCQVDINLQDVVKVLAQSARTLTAADYSFATLTEVKDKYANFI